MPKPADQINPKTMLVLDPAFKSPGIWVTRMNKNAPAICIISFHLPEIYALLGSQ